MRVVGVALVAVVLGGCGDAFTSRVDTVARVEGYELGVQPLAEIMATGKELPVRREVVEGVAVLWADYTLFADHLLAGDSLLDSVRVAAAMWADLEQEVASRFHDKLVGDSLTLDSAAVDSVYAAGQYRYVRQLFFSVNQDASPNVKEIKRRAADDTHRKLIDGTLTWGQATRLSEDSSSGHLIAHGETTPRLENVAFALAPGEISPVTETDLGFHIVFRPMLAEVRQAFRDDVETRLAEGFDGRYLDALPARWNIRVRGGIGPTVREVGRDPIRAKQSNKVIGSYRGGQFRVSDVARWLQAMPREVWQGLPGASDSQISGLVLGLIRNEVLLREAKAAGITVPPEVFAEVTDQLRRELALMSALLGMPLDSLPALRALSPEDRHQIVQTRVLEYLGAVAQNRKRLQTVPSALADQLRTEARWALVPAGVERVLDRARQLRLSLDSLTPAPAPAQPQPQQDRGN